MSDLNKDFGENNENIPDDHESKATFEEEIEDVQDNKDLEGCSQENKKEFFEKIEDDQKEKKGPFDEEKTTQEKSRDTKKETYADREKVGSDETVDKQCSSCYTPPYYVPNFTVNDSPANQEIGNAKHKNGSGRALKVALVSLLVAVALFGTFILGILSGRLDPLSITGQGDTIDLQGEEISVVKNYPQMNIVENTDSDYIPQSLPEVVQKVGNSVVEVNTSSVVTDRFYGQYVTSGAGSGVIITQNDSAGYLITNHHVVEDAKEIVVRLTNKEEYEAIVVNSSKSLDLAVLRIAKKSGENFTVAPIGDSSKLIVGQDVVAIGNPLGSLGGTVTDGIISALDRNVTIDGVSMTLLQHNAAINPGNSGGALFDMMGNLIGIVNAKSSDTGIEGLGFAIPVNIAFEYFKGVMQAASIGATVDYGYNNQHIYGVYVVKAYDSSPLQYLDRIIKINSIEIATLTDFYACIDDFKTGDTIEITVVRNNEETVLTVTLD